MFPPPKGGEARRSEGSTRRCIRVAGLQARISVIRKGVSLGSYELVDMSGESKPKGPKGRRL
jgi:hypothetical protein